MNINTQLTNTQTRWYVFPEIQHFPPQLQVLLVYPLPFWRVNWYFGLGFLIFFYSGLLFHHSLLIFLIPFWLILRFLFSYLKSEHHNSSRHCFLFKSMTLKTIFPAQSSPLTLNHCIQLSNISTQIYQGCFKLKQTYNYSSFNKNPDASSWFKISINIIHLSKKFRSHKSSNFNFTLNGISSLSSFKHNVFGTYYCTTSNRSLPHPLPLSPNCHSATRVVTFFFQ